VTSRIDVLTIFPQIIRDYCDASIVGRAREREVFELHVHDVREHANDVHRSVDDTPFGGGAGMVMRVESIVRTVRANPQLARPLIALTPSGRRFDHADAERLAALDGFSLLCGRYEGIDQRALDLVVDEEISLGDFVLAGGELAALCIIEAVIRLRPGALGNDDSIRDESFAHGLLEYPQYTKPADFEGELVPEILRSGDHGRIARWRLAQSIHRTQRLRPDLLVARGGLSSEELAVVSEFASEFAPGPNG
jgi:tRNA (guanine37-N1)-methyltransferase